MATRTPSLQTRSQYGSYWGVYANAAALPNVGTIAPANKIRPLEQGDIAYVVGAGFYQCDAPGVTAPPDGLAVWSAVGGAGSQDRFAPTFLVGNTAAGDSAVAYSSGGFNYYPDTGNGAQIAAALAAAAASPDRGRVYIRRGTYDLGAVGAPATPLAIVAGVAVQGEGNATRILASLVNQGIFTLANTSSLEQIRLEAVADPGSLGSVAMVVTSDSVTLDNVHFELGTDAAGALRQALRCTSVTAGADTRLSNIQINISSVTGALDPTVGIAADGAHIIGQGIEVNGGDQSFSLNDTNAELTQVMALTWDINGILHTGTGAVSLLTALVLSSGSDITAEGIVLASSGHTLIDVDVQAPALQQATAIRFSATTNNNRIEDCRITGTWADGIVLGTTAGGTASTNSTVTNCRIEAGGYGIRAAEGTSGLVLAKNQITVTSGGSALVAAGIRIEGNGSVDNTIEGNRISVTDLANAAYCIQHSGNTSTIRGNECSLSTGLNAIDTTGERNIIESNPVFVSGSTSGITVADGALYNIVNGNVVFTSDNPYVAEVIVYGGEYGVVNSNVTVVASAAPAASAGIRLTAASSNSNCIGNTCRGSSIAPIVNDLGTANNVAQNVGAL